MQMIFISHSDSSHMLQNSRHTPVTNWVMKAVVSADVDTKQLIGY